MESRGELQDFAQSKLKEVEDEIVSKLTTAMKEVVVWAYTHSPINFDFR